MSNTESTAQRETSGSVRINVASAEPGGKKNKKEGSDTEKKEEPTIPPVSTATLFRYATTKEYSLMALGISAAFIAGLCMPAMVILFGRLTNAFVYAELDYDYIKEAVNNKTGQNITDEDIMDYLGISDFNKDIKIFGYGVTLIGVLQFIMGYIFVTTLNYAAEGQVYRLRGLFLKSILRQEIGWFDTHETNNFASRVTEDLNKVQDGIGEKIGMFVFFFTTFVFSLINAFVHGWELTLVILSVFPVMVIATAAMAKLGANYTALEVEKYAKAGSVAEEALSSVRTVFSFGGEKKRNKKVREKS